jgi:hypothetical protein
MGLPQLLIRDRKLPILSLRSGEHTGTAINATLCALADLGSDRARTPQKRPENYLAQIAPIEGEYLLAKNIGKGLFTRKFPTRLKAISHAEKNGWLYIELEAAELPGGVIP